MPKRVILVPFILFLLISYFADSASADILSSPPVKVHLSAYGSTEKSQRGLFTTDFIIPLYYPENKETLFFFNPKYTYTTPHADEINQGIGLRHIFNDSFILGLNTFFDRRLARSGKWYSQAGLGLEYLSHPLDIRLNWYKPLTKAKVVNTTYGFGPTSLIQYDNKEEPLQGVDFEMGVPVFDKFTKTRLYCGGFFYQSKLSKDVNGFRARTETSLTKWLNLDTTFESKADGETKFYGGVRVILPFEWTKLFKSKKQPLDTPATPSSYLQERIFDRVVRDIDIQSKSSTTQSKKHDMTYVDNSNTTGIEDGSYEYPYTKVQDGVDNAKGGKWVYVRKGNSVYGEQVELTSGVTIWGSGYNGGFSGITATGYPIIDGGGILHPFYLEDLDNVTIMGVHARNCTNGVIYVNRSDHVTINNSIVSGNSISGGGIYFLGGENYTVLDIKIINNVLFDNDNSAICIATPWVPNSNFNGINITGNTIRDNLNGEGIFISNSTGTFSNITIADNNISDVFDLGIALDNNESLHDQAKLIEGVRILNNTVSTDLGDGIAFMIKRGALRDVVISGNNSSNNSAGCGLLVLADYGCTIDDVVIFNNTLSNNKFGLVFSAYDDDTSVTASAYRNIITDNSFYGVVTDSNSDSNVIVADLGGGSLGSVGYNSIYNNGIYDVFGDFLEPMSVTAKSNWWGRSAGPDPAKISGDVDYTPWLTSDPN